MKKVLLSILFIGIALISGPAFAQGNSNNNSSLFGAGGRILNALDLTGTAAGLSDEQRATTAPIVAINIINATLTLFGIAFTVLLIYGGWLWMSAAGNQDRVDQAKKVLQWAVIGVAIVMVSVSISVFVSNSLISATGGII